MALRMNSPLPDLKGATEWINSKGVTRDELIGRPVLVHFWAVSCGICKQVMPKLNEWREKYAPAGLQLVGVHMPRSEKDTDVQAVRDAIEHHGLVHAQAIDNQHTITDAFENEFVPAYFLFNEQGEMKFRTAGDRGIMMLEARLEKLLAQPVSGPAK